ncbi:hypothetical protein BASA50_004331 [Batrachochytrium salamandrivorans]|uniref:NADH dehydrogenase [ubiquinone] 1 beta subcomplex subunit 11, mitochondrial n=1 Tax=Batrachochytrium salamandrivorans TaxID=1357716 RepID=A0ABQ8FIY1_9FUNG|nr:hypothetical protein BASA62_001014 [Batrachochytrium salamandrivorans]KAH6597726.1 hypothetical protein BASA50_004331 [Batrachochytrium salamandrivorans]KAH6601977.1 hypothetical protein BASA61_001575 [Batrachochytrium salamandrivorans]KAH9264689.1 hypothetical protein BASA83_011792 [Batrachochytrium salamandrivorans]
MNGLGRLLSAGSCTRLSPSTLAATIKATGPASTAFLPGPLSHTVALLGALRPLGSGLRASSGSSYIGQGTNFPRPPQDQIRPVPHQEWTNRFVKPTVPELKIDPEDLFQHPQYTPPPKVSTSIGPLVGPLHMPEFDQSRSDWRKTGVRSWNSLVDIRFESGKDSLIGDYPRIEPQFSWIRDPYNYWDQQGRRNFGEVLYDHDHFTDAWGIGPATDWHMPVTSAVIVLSFVALVTTSIYLWDTESHLWFAEKDYPFNGLRVELGGDPDDESDDWMAAPVYKI